VNGADLTLLEAAHLDDPELKTWRGNLANLIQLVRAEERQAQAPVRALAVVVARKDEAGRCAKDVCAWCDQGLPVLHDCIMGWHHVHNKMQVNCYATPIWSRREQETNPNQENFL